MHTNIYVAFIFVVILFLAGCVEPGESTYNQGVKALNSGKTAEAHELFVRALEENPHIAEAYLNLGRIHMKQGTYAAAREKTLIALQMLEKNQKTIISGNSWKQQAALACNNMASIAFQQGLELKQSEESDPAESARLFDEAKSWLAQAYELDPESELIQKNRAFIQRWGQNQ